MSLELRHLVAGRNAPLSVAVPAGGWAQVQHPEPDLLADAVAGVRPASGEVAVAGRELGAAPSVQRVRAGLAVVNGRLPALPALRVLDVILLARTTESSVAWRAALGSRKARSLLADEEALARNVAGRLHLAEWADEPATGLPDQVAALADLGRAVAARPRALVWALPHWLGATEVEEVTKTLRAEQSRAGWAVLEVRLGGTPAPPGPVVIEVPQ